MALFSEVIYLLSKTVSTNAMGDVIKTPTERMIFASKKSIRQSEFYQAQATGLKPEITFIIYTDEYNDEQKIMFNNKVYSVIRTFDTGEKLELICEGVVNNGNA